MNVISDQSKLIQQQDNKIQNLQIWNYTLLAGATVESLMLIFGK